MAGILESGSMRKISGGKKEQVPFEMRVLDGNWLDATMRIQDVIVERLSRPDLLESFSREFMRLHFGEKGRVLGIVADGELVAKATHRIVGGPFAPPAPQRPRQSGSRRRAPRTAGTRAGTLSARSTR